MARTRGTYVLMVVAVFGCATSRPQPPPLQHLELGKGRANYRDFSTASRSLCTGEPRWLQDEFSSVNGLLARWLEETSAGYDGAWTSEQLSLLQRGISELGPLLEIHAQNLVQLRTCRFAKERAFPDLIQRGDAFIEQVRHRMVEGPAIMAFRAARLAQQMWHTEQPMRELRSRAVCPAKVLPGASAIHYAVESDAGVTRWLFCDGGQVTRRRHQEPEVQLPSGLTAAQRKRVKPAAYLKAVADYPEAGVDRPPAPPRRLDEPVNE
jgi:hypothetical protein